MTDELIARDSCLAGVFLDFEVREVLCEEQTPFQKMGFYRTDHFGVLFILDGAVMLTERDEFVYHEMLTHVALFAHPNPRRVLIIGGGDLGAIRECLKHPTVEEVHLCEIDGRVVEASRQFLPWAEPAARDRRTTISVADGFELLKQPQYAGRYDVILMDVTDAVGLSAQEQSARLFTSTFFGFLKRALAPGGIVCGQSECAFWYPDFIAQTHGELRRQFTIVRNYVATIPTYMGSLWTFYFASDAVDPLRDFRQSAFAALRPTAGFRYYSDAIHRACFTLPADLQAAIDRKGESLA
jgi:spermidine synthase